MGSTKQLSRSQQATEFPVEEQAAEFTVAEQSTELPVEERNTNFPGVEQPSEVPEEEPITQSKGGMNIPTHDEAIPTKASTQEPAVDGQHTELSDADHEAADPTMTSQSGQRI